MPISSPYAPCHVIPPVKFRRLTSFAAARELALEPVGPHFLAHARRKRHNRTFSEDEKHQAEVHALSLEDKSGNVSEDSEPEDEEMLMRDPKEWKVRTPFL
jgi:DnaJ homolog subfamily C member 2